MWKTSKGSVDDLKRRREEAYQRWCKVEENSLFVKASEYFIRHVLFGCFYGITIIYPLQDLSCWTIIKFCLIFTCLETVYFGVNHVNTHAYMMTYQMYNLVEAPLPYAFYHHYRNPWVMSTYPYQYRMGVVSLMAHFYIDLCSFLCGVSPIVSYFFMIVWLVDYGVHQYYHTAMYDSMNPLSTKFIGLGVIYKFWSAIAFVDKKEHLSVHHSIKNFKGMSRTEGWIDFGPPVWSRLVDTLCDSLFEVEIYVLHYVKHERGWSLKSVQNLIIFFETAYSLITFCVCNLLQHWLFPQLENMEVRDCRLLSLAVTIVFITESFIITPYVLS